MKPQTLPKLITIVGPTASGKTSLGLAIAKDVQGEIISADSRQVYRHMDIGTAKEAGDWKYRIGTPPYRAYMVKGVAHHLIDYIGPRDRYTVAQFQHDAVRKIHAIHARNHIPIMVGGTGLYVQSVVDNFLIPTVEPDEALRARLEHTATKDLIAELTTLDASKVAQIDVHNRRRIIRAIEVAHEPNEFSPQQAAPLFDTLQIGIHIEREVLYTRINNRVNAMIDTGLIEEIQSLLARGYTWDLASMSGVGYRQFRPYFEGTTLLDECIEVLKRDTRRYAKRQLTWFRRDPRIIWCSDSLEAKEHIQSFLSS